MCICTPCKTKMDVIQAGLAYDGRGGFHKALTFEANCPQANEPAAARIVQNPPLRHFSDETRRYPEQTRRRGPHFRNTWRFCRGEAIGIPKTNHLCGPASPSCSFFGVDVTRTAIRQSRALGFDTACR